MALVTVTVVAFAAIFIQSGFVETPAVKQGEEPKPLLSLEIQENRDSSQWHFGSPVSSATRQEVAFKRASAPN